MSETKIPVVQGEGRDTTVLFLDAAEATTQCWSDSERRTWGGQCWRYTAHRTGLCREHRCEILGQDCFTPEERTAYNRRHDA